MASKVNWPAIGFVVGIVGWAAVRYGIGTFGATHGGQAATGAGHAASAGALDGCAWAVLGICWLGAGLSWIERRRRARADASKAGPVAAAGSPAATAATSKPEAASATAARQAAEEAAPPSRRESLPQPESVAAPSCPRCGAAMYRRYSMQDGKMYWGCVMYPACKGAQPI